MRATRATTASRRWIIFGGVSALALAACYVAVLGAAGRTSAGLAVLGGLIVVGIAAAFMDALTSSYPEPRAGSQVPRGANGLGGFGDGSGGGDGGADGC